MKVIILAETTAKAHDFRRAAGLPKADVVIASSEAHLRDLVLTHADLIVEFPGFDHRPDADAIRRTLAVSVAKVRGAKPIWERIKR